MLVRESNEFSTGLAECELSVGHHAEDRGCYGNAVLC